MLKFQDEYRDPGLCQKVASSIRDISKREITIMEVCGGHTMAIRKNGLHKIVGDKVRLLSGPGCPVCVTSMVDIDMVVELSKKELSICTFGDLFYVPGTYSSLEKEKANGADVRVVYSVYDVIEYARQEPQRNFVFISIGFETTTPSIAAAILQAELEGLNNFYILPLNKTMPEALRIILNSKESRINALICPGHVSVITGIGIYEFIVDEFYVSCCVSGFEPLDILRSIEILVRLWEEKRVDLVNAYPRAVELTGNNKATSIMYKVFQNSDASWRGLGVIPLSGLELRVEYKRFDALKRFKITKPESIETPGCLCGELLRGLKEPKDCKLFATACTPQDPKGACMVSSEGSCAAWYRYGE